MATDSPDESAPPTKTVSLRLLTEEVAALEYLAELFAPKYDGTSSVLRDYSVTQAVETHKRAQQMAGAAA